MDKEVVKPKKRLSDEILDFEDERTELVTVPEWGGKKVLCKNMTGADRAILSNMLDIDARTNKVKSTSTSADIVILGAYNPETGERIFSPTQKERLLAKNSSALERLATVINRLSGIGEEEKIEKN